MIYHRIDLLPLLSQGEEGGGEEDEGDQGKPHLCQRGNHQELVTMRRNSYLWMMLGLAHQSSMKFVCLELENSDDA